MAALRLTTHYTSSSWSAGVAQVASGATNQVATTHRVGGLSRRVVHEFRTRAVNANGIAGLASPSVALVPLRTQPMSGTDQVWLSWDRPAGYGGLAWQYRYKEASSTTWGDWTPVADNSVASQTVSDLTHGASYQFQVRALSGTTAPSRPGTYSASLNASNSYGTDSESLTINVKRRSVSTRRSPSSPSAESGVEVRGMGRCPGLVAVTWPGRTAEGDTDRYNIHRSVHWRRM